MWLCSAAGPQAFLFSQTSGRPEEKGRCPGNPQPGGCAATPKGSRAVPEGKQPAQVAPSQPPSLRSLLLEKHHTSGSERPDDLGAGRDKTAAAVGWTDLKGSRVPELPDKIWIRSVRLVLGGGRAWGPKR